ncbi:MAG: hypothetical protein C4523_18075 [Myxococcales bacterium]|nr:MAG: hypothetical protein C4523_18075 [Myxococcales bacterium]
MSYGVSRWAAKMRHILLLAALALPAACATLASYKDGVVETKHTRYRVEAPGKAWERIGVRNGDLAFWRDDLHAFILLNSTCDEYRDAPVESLANHLFIGIENKNFVEQKETPLDGRNAVYSVVEGELDGAPVKVAAYTLVRDYCTYDLSFSAPPERFEAGMPDFERVAARFHVVGRRD